MLDGTKQGLRDYLSQVPIDPNVKLEHAAAAVFVAQQLGKLDSLADQLITELHTLKTPLLQQLALQFTATAFLLAMQRAAEDGFSYWMPLQWYRLQAIVEMLTFDVMTSKWQQTFLAPGIKLQFVCKLIAQAPGELLKFSKENGEFVYIPANYCSASLAEPGKESMLYPLCCVMSLCEPNKK